MVSKEFMERFQNSDYVHVIVRDHFNSTPDNTEIGFNLIGPLPYPVNRASVSVEDLFQALKKSEKLKEVFKPKRKGSKTYSGEFTKDGKQKLADILEKKIEYFYLSNTDRRIVCYYSETLKPGND